MSEPVDGDSNSGLESSGESRAFDGVTGEKGRIDVESELTNVVEGEAFKSVLEVESVAGDGGGGKDRKEVSGGLELESGGEEGADGVGIEVVAGGFALENPVVTVGVEDAVSEEVVESGDGRRAFRVVGEVGFEDMLDVGRGGGDDGGGHGDGVDGAGEEELGGPI